VIRHAARQCVRYESWRLTSKEERQGAVFPEPTGEKIIARLVPKGDPRWGRMASAALMLTRIVDFRADCGRPLTVSEQGVVDDHGRALAEEFLFKPRP